jgi:hypothetical protein
VAHVDIHDVGAGIEVVSPDAAQQLFARENLTGVVEEDLGEGELAR